MKPLDKAVKAVFYNNSYKKKAIDEMLKSYRSTPQSATGNPVQSKSQPLFVPGTYKIKNLGKGGAVVQKADKLFRRNSTIWFLLADQM